MADRRTRNAPSSQRGSRATSRRSTVRSDGDDKQDDRQRDVGDERQHDVDLSYAEQQAKLAREGVGGTPSEEGD